MHNDYCLDQNLMERLLIEFSYQLEVANPSSYEDLRDSN